MQPAATVKINYMLVNDEVFDSDISIYTYTEKSVAMTCNEHFGKAFLEYLKEIGKYNPNLKIGKGWILSVSKYKELQNLIAKISDKQIKGAIPVVYRRKSVELVAPIIEPMVVLNFKNLISELTNEKESKNIFTTQDNTYIWGSKIEVQNILTNMNKEAITTFTLNDKCIVVTK